MPISRERFAQGLTADEFIAEMTRNQERFEDNLAAMNDFITDEDRAFFGGRRLAIAAIAEDWCTDVIQFLAPVIALARQVPDLELRVFLRDQNHDLIDQYLKQGKFRSIPVFVLYDERWNELGYFIERPEQVTREMAEETRRFAAAHPEIEGITRAYENMPEETRKAVSQNSSRYRWDNMLRWDRICLDELRGMVVRGAEQRAVAD
ncbi:MAG TPA: thioredoxin family protein [Thermomicrobiaceae bacterium]|nr:thioredoxin family protein [Thermomicrobiaceae bacterium]